MQTPFTVHSTTGEIVLRFPKASSILRENKIGFCCKNNRPIGEMATEAGMEKHQLLEQINSFYDSIHAIKEQDQDQWTIESMLAYSQDVHTQLKIDIPEIHDYVSKIYRVHGGKQPELVTVYTLYHLLMEKLSHLLTKKEQAIFPRIKSNPSNEPLEDVKNELMDDYKQIRTILSSLRQTTGNFSVPDWSCHTFRLAFLKLEELESDLLDLIQLESAYLLNHQNN